MKRDQPLKNAYDRTYVERLAEALDGSREGASRQQGFVRAVFAPGWGELELKGRMNRIAETLDAQLPADLAAALAVLDPVVPRFDGYLAMFFPAFVELRVMREVPGMWDLGVGALARYTEFSSAEFAVRPLLLADPERMLAEMLRWTRDGNHHVRRLASEGCRPRLPWAMALPPLKADPAPLMPILEALRDDESEYVRRSVANNLNDVAKDHPESVLEVAERWLEGGACSEERRRLVKHACRTLLKAGDPRAMRLFGFRDPAGIVVEAFELDRAVVAVGDHLEFRFRLCARVGGSTPGKAGSKDRGDALGRVRLEYAVHYQKKNGSLAPKVFKISEFETDDAERDVVRRHAFRELSTRRLHPGPHELELRINGVEKARLEFVLEE
jgi:3-methyladenine DNA glycosylase AlkC